MRKLEKIIVINKRAKHQEQYVKENTVYVGRPHVLGNPYTHLDKPTLGVKVATREEAIQKFQDWLHDKLCDLNTQECKEIIRMHQHALTNTLYLECWCKDEIRPSKADKPCHAEVIRNYIQMYHEHIYGEEHD